jgi:sugar transferase EpsL
MHTFQQSIKRTIDIIVSVSVLAFCLPLMLCIGLLIHLKMGNPILFRQQRPGIKGWPFIFYKFRTMNDSCGSDGKLLADSERLTEFGSFLRRWSIDELPQFWNVLRGEMSLVGPRPLLMDYLDLYSPEQARRQDVKPGITGWAQIHGRNAITWEKRLTLDVWYVDHWNVFLDIQILLRTILKVFRRDGINFSNHATMPKFQATLQSSDKLENQEGKAA